MAAQFDFLGKRRLTGASTYSNRFRSDGASCWCAASSAAGLSGTIGVTSLLLRIFRSLQEAIRNDGSDIGARYFLASSSPPRKRRSPVFRRRSGAEGSRPTGYRTLAEYLARDRLADAGRLSVLIPVPAEGGQKTSPLTPSSTSGARSRWSRGPACARLRRPSRRRRTCASTGDRWARPRGHETACRQAVPYPARACYRMRWFLLYDYTFQPGK